MPPLTPALCIEAGYFLTHGCFLTEFTMETLWRQLGDRILEWILGSLVLAPVLASLTALAVWLTALFIRSGMKRRQS